MRASLRKERAQSRPPGTPRQSDRRGGKEASGREGIRSCEVMEEEEAIHIFCEHLLLPVPGKAMRSERTPQTKSSDGVVKLSQCEVSLTETLSGSSSHRTALCSDGDRVGAARACPANSPPGDLEPVLPTPTTPLLCHPCGWCQGPSGPAEPRLFLCLSTTAGAQQFRRPSGRARLGKGQEGGRRSRP